MTKAGSELCRRNFERRSAGCSANRGACLSGGVIGYTRADEYPTVSTYAEISHSMPLHSF